MLIRPWASTPMTPALAPASTASVNRRRLRHDARGEQARNVKMRIREHAQLDDRGNIVGVEEDADLWLRLANICQRLARRLGEGIHDSLIDLDLGLIDNIEVLVQHGD